MTGFGFVSTDLLISIILSPVHWPRPGVPGVGRPVKTVTKKTKNPQKTP